ncbi:MAG: molybdopterin-dependent oxidoreductase [Dehalococcoidia bacterium]
MTETKVIKTACQFCGGCCGVNAYVEDGKLVKVEGMKEHPTNEGKLCAKGLAAMDYVYAKDRILHPLKRVGDKWERITWDEALDTIAGKLQEVKDQYGPQSAVVCMGMVQLTQGIGTQELIRRFTDIYGTPNVFSVDSMCFRSRLVGHILTTGKYAIADPANANCIILWATNPQESAPFYSWILNKALKRDPKLIVIDPRRTPPSKKAHIHAQPRPGTDGALMLAMLHVIIGEGLFDREFVEKWSVGFDKLEEHVKAWTPERVAGITRVPAETIRDIARTFATVKPATIVQGTNPLDQQASGLHNNRMIAMLHFLTGNFDVPGGFVTTPGVRYNPVRVHESMQGEPVGIDKFPLFYGVFGREFGESQSMLLPDMILSEKPNPVKVAIFSGSNALATWPNANKMREALKKLDLLVVADLFMTEMAEMAHIVLPAASFYERTDFVDMYRLLSPNPYVMLRKKVIEPLGESRSDLDFWFALARRMGYGEAFPWKTQEEAIDHLLEPSGFTVKGLTEDTPEGAFIRPISYKSYEKKGFQTPSGKVELYSEELAKLGHSPLPVFIENPESPESRPDLAREYPLVLTTGGRILHFQHSQLRNIPRQRKKYPDPLAEVNTLTAQELGVADGDEVVISTQRGSIEVKAKVTEDIMAGVVHMTHGWGQKANVNLLTDNAPADAIVGYPALKGLLCRMAKKAS